MSIAKALGLSCWTNPTDAQPLGGGITNENIKVTDQGRHYVVRLGDDIGPHMILRWHEAAISRAAHAAGIAPRVHHVEPGVLVLDYIDAQPLTEADLHDHATLMATVDQVRALHHDGPQHLRGPILTFWVFHILRDYAATLRDLNSDHVPKLDRLLTEAHALEAAVGPVHLVLGHNDLLPANILRGADRLWLIDWEYAGFNSALFDLGGLATNADLTPEAQDAMLIRYFGSPPNAALRHSYGAMKCASLLRETLWSMVSERTSTLDFDYAGYTAKNLERYTRAHAHFTSKEHL
jgi:thiamine kinase-like enzyme